MEQKSEEQQSTSDRKRDIGKWGGWGVEGGIRKKDTKRTVRMSKNVIRNHIIRYLKISTIHLREYMDTHR